MKIAVGQYTHASLKLGITFNLKVDSILVVFKSLRKVSSAMNPATVTGSTIIKSAKVL